MFFLVKPIASRPPVFVAHVVDDEVFAWFEPRGAFVYDACLTREWRDFLSDMQFEPIAAGDVAGCCSEIADRAVGSGLAGDLLVEKRVKTLAA